MLGGVFSDQHCSICGKTFRDNGKHALVCPEHKEQRATRFIVKFNKVWKRFKTYERAHRFLAGLRFKTDEGTFDFRDYRAENPLGFRTQIEKWLLVKKQTVKRKSFNNLNNYAQRAITFFDQMNVKEIGYAELEDFLFAQHCSDKTRANMRSGIHDFFVWLRRRKVITPQQFPEFPEVSFELGYRQTISKDEQEAILEEVKRISWLINPKVWIAIKFLCTYISIRPGELITLKEGDIDYGNRYLFFPHPKEKKHKLVPILDEDVELLKSFPRGIPSLPFFRHVKGISGVKEGKPFGDRYLWKWWNKACTNLGITGVDLYGGTRHSSAKALRHSCSPEEIKRATMHSTNKAFERYFNIESEDLRNIYGKTRGATKVQPKIGPSPEAKLLNFKE